MNICLLFFAILVLRITDGCLTSEVEVTINRSYGSNKQQESYSLHSINFEGDILLQNFGSTENAGTTVICLPTEMIYVNMVDTEIDGWSYGSKIEIIVNDAVIKEMYLLGGITRRDTFDLSSYGPVTPFPHPPPVIIPPTVSPAGDCGDGFIAVTLTRRYGGMNMFDERYSFQTESLTGPYVLLRYGGFETVGSTVVCLPTEMIYVDLYHLRGYGWSTQSRVQVIIDGVVLKELKLGNRMFTDTDSFDLSSFVRPTTLAPRPQGSECTDGFIHVVFEQVSGNALCSVRLSDLSKIDNGLMLIANLIVPKANCLNPGYYYLDCDGVATISVQRIANTTITDSHTLTAPSFGMVITLTSVEDNWTSVPDHGYEFDKNKPVSGKPAVPLHPITDNEDFTCDDNGFKSFLTKWGSKKPTYNDSEYMIYRDHFIDSCEKIHEWNKKQRYQMEFTYYSDWSPEEFDQLTSTKQRYSGIIAPSASVVPIFNNSNYRYLMPSTDPCDDMFEDHPQGNTLREAIIRPQNCSTSWAFAVTNAIEYAIKKLYLDDYDQIVEVALSAQELIDCVGKEHGVVGKVCDAVSLIWSFDYVFENGIAYRQFYRHTNTEGLCLNVADDQKYHIAGYEKPSSYNKHGLFELMMKGPTAVTLGLDPEFFQFYRNDRVDGPYLDTAFYRPSVYGVIVEYSQYAIEGQSGSIMWPFFAIETRLRACDSFVFRLPIRDSIEDGNIAGITGFAIRPIVSDLLPTPVPPVLPTVAPAVP